MSVSSVANQLLIAKLFMTYFPAQEILTGLTTLYSVFSPLQGGGLSPGQQEVVEIDGEVVLVELLVLLHGGQVNIDEVPRVLSVQSRAVFLYLI